MDAADELEPVDVAALAALEKAPAGTVMTVNLGTGCGGSVLALVENFECTNQVPVPRRGVLTCCACTPRRFNKWRIWRAS